MHTTTEFKFFLVAKVSDVLDNINSMQNKNIYIYYLDMNFYPGSNIKIKVKSLNS